MMPRYWAKIIKDTHVCIGGKQFLSNNLTPSIKAAIIPRHGQHLATKGHLTGFDLLRRPD